MTTHPGGDGAGVAVPVPAYSMKMSPRRRALSAPQLLAASVAGLVLLGSALLALPAAAASGHDISYLDALFTATSAICVTGLIVVDTPTAFSTFGHIVILLLIQIGGLGYMTITTVVAAALGRSISLHERLTLQEALNTDTLEGLVRFAGVVLKMTLAFEFAGAVVLTARWWPDFGPSALWYALFHSVSAFNNAGFALWSDSLMQWRADWTVNLVVIALVTCGGLGFFVLTELSRVRTRHLRLSTHTRIALAASAVLTLGGTVAFFVLEAFNPRTLGPLPMWERLLASWFQSVTTRTAGFNTLDISGMTEASLFLAMAFMFIGASPGGTGGGVKTTTFSITVAALWATVRGDADTTMFKRRVPPETVGKAFFVCLVGFLALNVVAGTMLVSEGRGLMSTLFETTSAFGTVGLSMGEGDQPVSLVGLFTPAGKVLVMFMMFAGRVGPMTLAVALAHRAVMKPKTRYPEGKVLIG
jgi:trk system potassium uptake protein